MFLVLGLINVVLAQTETAKQPNCDEIEGLPVDYLYLVPEDYTGIGKICKDGKVIELGHFKDGKQDGLNRVWDKNGQLSHEGEMPNLWDWDV